MDSQSRLRQKQSNVSSDAETENSAIPPVDPIRAKLPYTSGNEAESGDDVDDDGFDVISYWAMGASAWSVSHSERK